jgi:hypothetical protein
LCAREVDLEDDNQAMAYEATLRCILGVRHRHRVASTRTFSLPFR